MRRAESADGARYGSRAVQPRRLSVRREAARLARDTAYGRRARAYYRAAAPAAQIRRSQRADRSDGGGNPKRHARAARRCAGRPRGAQRRATRALVDGALLEWHRREDKAAWWEFFRLRDLSAEDYEEERSALTGLTFNATIGGTARRPVNRYAFPPQEHDVRRRDEACMPPDGDVIGEIVEPSTSARTRSTFSTRATARPSGPNGSS